MYFYEVKYTIIFRKSAIVSKHVELVLLKIRNGDFKKMHVTVAVFYKNYIFY